MCEGKITYCAIYFKKNSKDSFVIGIIVKFIWKLNSGYYWCLEIVQNFLSIIGMQQYILVLISKCYNLFSRLNILKILKNYFLFLM